jgi:hypothetical protein
MMFCLALEQLGPARVIGRDIHILSDGQLNTLLNGVHSSRQWMAAYIEH